MGEHWVSPEDRRRYREEERERWWRESASPTLIKASLSHLKSMRGRNLAGWLEQEEHGLWSPEGARMFADQLRQTADAFITFATLLDAKYPPVK